MAEYERPTSDFVTSTLNGAIAAGDTTITIGTGLDLPATNGILQIDYDSSTAVGADNGPETISYATYDDGTGALGTCVRGLNGTTGVAHANGAKVQCGFSVSYFGGAMIKNDDLETTAGEPGGAWKSWTPTWANFTIAKATLNYAVYTQIGKTVHFRIKITCTSDAVGTGPTFTLPVTAHADYAAGLPTCGTTKFTDTGGTPATYAGITAIASETTGKAYLIKTDSTYGSYSDITATVPFTWANTDILQFSGTYEAA